MLKAMAFVLLLGLAFTASPGSKIYKYTDENGDVHYTDRNPDEHDSTSEIKSVKVVESDLLNSSSNWKRTAHQIKKHASEFNDFIIATPKNNTTVLSHNGNILASVRLDGKLDSKYRVKFYLDKIPHGKVKSSTQLIADIEHGEHTLYAEVIEHQSRRVIKTTPVITFELKNKPKQ